MQFGDNWDLVEERLGGPDPEVPPLELGPLLGEVDAVVAMGTQCRVSADDLLRPARRGSPTGRRACGPRWTTTAGSSAWAGRPASRWAASAEPATGPTSIGSATGSRRLEPLRDDMRDRVQQACLERIAAELARFTVDAAEERRRAGELEFHDLLVLARAVLRDPVHGVEVRAAAAERYQRLLLDEFQDTDPIQVELAVLIASSDPDGRDQAVVGGGRRTGQAVLRRRPEAVDLPVPPGRHRHVPAGPRPVRRRRRTADGQLPHHRTDPGMGQPHVRAAHL